MAVYHGAESNGLQTSVGLLIKDAEPPTTGLRRINSSEKSHENNNKKAKMSRADELVTFEAQAKATPIDTRKAAGSLQLEARTD